MAIIYETIVAEDLDLGHGTVSKHMPAGGTATGNRINLATFKESGQLYAAIPAASDDVGALRVVSDAVARIPGTTVAGGGTYRVLVFSNGTTWVVVAG